MKEPAANSLSRLNDLVLPPSVSWWPLAPGWYAVMIIIAIALIFLLIRSFKQWRANAYRRAALRELDAAEGAAAICEILRRTALAFAPRADVVGLTGQAWVDWLAKHGSGPVPASVSHAMTAGIYERSSGELDASGLREYAARWIKQHRPSGDGETGAAAV